MTISKELYDAEKFPTFSQDELRATPTIRYESNQKYKRHLNRGNWNKKYQRYFRFSKTYNSLYSYCDNQLLPIQG